MKVRTQRGRFFHLFLLLFFVLLRRRRRCCRRVSAGVGCESKAGDTEWGSFQQIMRQALKNIYIYTPKYEQLQNASMPCSVLHDIQVCIVNVFVCFYIRRGMNKQCIL